MSKLTPELLARIQNPRSLGLPDHARELLGSMFSAYEHIVLEAELVGGFSGSRLYKLIPFRDADTRELSTVVKLAPAAQVRQEFDAYHAFIRGRLSGVPEIWGQPVYTADGAWGGLRYAMVGSDLFEIESLANYCLHASSADIAQLLEGRLFVQLGALWQAADVVTRSRQDCGYGALLPVALTLKPVERTPSMVSMGADSDVSRLTDSSLDWSSLEAGATVVLDGGVASEVSLERKAVTFVVNGAEGHLGSGIRVRLQPVPDIDGYQVGRPLEAPVIAEVTETRRTLLKEMVSTALGAGPVAGTGTAPDIGAPSTVNDLDAETLALDLDESSLSLPNPLRHIDQWLREPRPIRLGTIHGDLNPDNVLVDPAARTARLIDFSASREDHVLHDLLRLETSVLARLLPRYLDGAGLPPTAVATLLDGIRRSPEAEPTHRTLRPIHIILVAIRRAAAALLAVPDDWTEYDESLALYLVGACKFANLSAEAKQVVFWGAARSAELALSPPKVDGTALRQAMAVLLNRNPQLDAYRRGRVEQWSGPRHDLDKRFVALSLLIDQGETSPSGRWKVQEMRYEGLRQLLESSDFPTVVLLGSPGSGKSTLLRQLELELALDGLSNTELPVTFFVPLNLYKATSADDTVPPPRIWLTRVWASRFPDMPRLDTLINEGRLWLLADGLNEIPSSGAADARQLVLAWKDFVQELAEAAPRCRVVFSCRSLDYSTPLSTPALRVPQVRIEPLDDGQMERFLEHYLPDRARQLWPALRGRKQLDLFRSPFFLRLLIDLVGEAEEVPDGPAAMFTAFVRQALVREIERDNPLFLADTLLTERDCRRLVMGTGRDAPYALPESGVLIPRLSSLAFQMQRRSRVVVAQRQLRIEFDSALRLIDHPRADDILQAGEALAVLDEDSASDEVFYIHQLFQEYFAGRQLSRNPSPELSRLPWRSTELSPSLSEVMSQINPADELPPLDQSGWEETMLMAAAMADDPDSFVGALTEENLVLAGRCAAQPELQERLSHAILDDLRHRLVRRSRDPEADLRVRIDAGLALGGLGDPRFPRRRGPHGEFLVPPMIPIPAGDYVIGSDSPIAALAFNKDAHIPAHQITLPAFAIGQFPVTNAEFDCFVQAGGYDDEPWWDTDAAKRWRAGDGTADGNREDVREWLRVFRDDPAILRAYDEGNIDDENLALWRRRLAMTEAELEAHLAEYFPSGRFTAPRHRNDQRFNGPLQPVVGICWYEARAYCNWLSAQLGRPFRLPSEVEWEVAAAGSDNHAKAPSELDALPKANTVEMHLWRTTPVGVFLESDSQHGVSDMSGNVLQWTTSIWGRRARIADFGYPYEPTDGREDEQHGTEHRRIIRGGSWFGSQDTARVFKRDYGSPDSWYKNFGFRLASSALDAASTKVD